MTATALPRYVVRELRGFRWPAVGAYGRPVGLSVMVMDRILCYRVVEELQSESPRWREYADRFRAMRDEAQALADRLNTSDAEALRAAGVRS